MGLVLVIDDDPHVRESTALLLRGAGLEVIEADSGESGIEAAKRRRPDVILLDLLMPGIDGWETLERLKVEEATADTPVIVFSARPQNGAPVDGTAPRLLSKPFDPGALIDLVRRYVAEGERARRTA